MTSRVAGTTAAATLGPVAGLVGGAVFGGATLVAAIAYSGVAGESFSPLTHWVSELGEVGVSSLSAPFNIGLIVGGLGFAIFMGAFGRVRGGSLAAAAGLVGIGSGIFGVLIGVFPTGQSDLHRPVSIGFFLLGAIALALASADVSRRPNAAFPRWLAWLGAVVVAGYVGFIIVTLTSARVDYTEVVRPSFLLEPALEWVAVGGTLLWTAVASATWLRARA